MFSSNLESVRNLVECDVSSSQEGLMKVTLRLLLVNWSTFNEDVYSSSKLTTLLRNCIECQLDNSRWGRVLILETCNLTTELYWVLLESHIKLAHHPQPMLWGLFYAFSRCALFAPTLLLLYSKYKKNLRPGSFVKWWGTYFMGGPADCHGCGDWIQYYCLKVEV